MGVSLEKSGFSSVSTLTKDLVNTLIANGFTAKFPLDGSGNYVVPTTSSYTIVLEAGASVDPLYASQPWRINLKVYDNATLGIVAGSATALPGDGSLPYSIDTYTDTSGNTPVTSTFYASPYGVVGAPYTKYSGFMRYSAAKGAPLCRLWPTQIQRSAISDSTLPYYVYGAVLNTTISGQVYYYVENDSTGNKVTVLASSTTLAVMEQQRQAALQEYVEYTDSLKVASMYDDFCQEKPDGLVPAQITDPADLCPAFGDTSQGFINRCHRTWINITVPNTDFSYVTSTDTLVEIPQKPDYPGSTLDVSTAYRMSYRISVSNRGLFLAVWEGDYTNSDAEFFSWMLVQRPVSRDTGATVVDGKAPVFCVNSVGNQIQRFVVREADVLQATVAVDATKNATDINAIINDGLQVGVAEDNEYVVNIPGRLNTPRYTYTYELDMIGYASATVVSGGTEVTQTLYGESASRTYTGMMANLPNQNGMRILCLTSTQGL